MHIKFKQRTQLQNAFGQQPVDIRHFMIVRKNRRTEVQKYKKAKVRQSLEFEVMS